MKIGDCTWRNALRSVGAVAEGATKDGLAKAHGPGLGQAVPQRVQPFCLPGRVKGDPPAAPSLGVHLSLEGNGTGAVIARVDLDSPAQRAGLAAGDRITKISNLTVRSYRDALATLEFFAPEAAVKIDVVRSGGGAPETIRVER